MVHGARALSTTAKSTFSIPWSRVLRDFLGRDARAHERFDAAAAKKTKKTYATKTKGRRAKAAQVENEGEITALMDMREPGAWYPLARTLRREITLHVGPTNSGKTYAAMQRLKGAASGVYCAPLRLLAWVISEHMTREGVLCTLTTGQECRVVPLATHGSCTVEMADTSTVIDCAVIDEIQLLSDPHRGYAYTRALLGLPALELHLCGDPRVVPLVKKIIKATGDMLVVKNYERLSPLEVAEGTVAKLSEVRKGDALVAFSRTAVYRLKREVEISSEHRACVIYGGLPPETRSRQAELFNERSSGYDVLIASDAIGMGLNLNIKRVIFTTMSKFDGVELRPLESAEAKQIAGRAGRYGLEYGDMGGVVATRSTKDRALLVSALNAEIEPLKFAGVAPTFEQVEQYCSLSSKSDLVAALNALTSSAKLAPHFRMRDMDEIIAVAKLVQKLPLALEDHFMFAIAPVDVRDPMVVSALLTFAREFCTHGRVGVRIISLPPARTPTGSAELAKLESAHKCLDLYLWLARRLPQAFPEEDLANAYRAATATAISAGLQNLSLGRKTKSSVKSTYVSSVLPNSAVRDAFSAVEHATKLTEDERERLGLPRLNDAERKAAKSMSWRFVRKKCDADSATTKPKRVHVAAAKTKKSKAVVAVEIPKKASHLRPSWLAAE